MENKDMPAFPQTMAECNGGITEILDFNPCSIGLTKRELIAAMAMNGFLASFAGHHSNPQPNIVAAKSVEYTDALLSELSKPQP